MASWSERRKYAYFFGFVVSLVILIGVPVVYILYEKPTCFDGKQNGTERGVDCSGACVKLCPADFASPRVLWSYTSRVVPGVYNALAYVQNPNPDVEALSVPYVFKLYNSQGELIAEKEGYTFVPGGQRFAVFLGGIQLQSVPTRTTFEFGSIPSWRQVQPLTEIKVVTTNIQEGSRPSVEVVIENISLQKDFDDVDVFIILYDAEGNRVAFSKTFIERLSAKETTTVYFTWPESFERPVVKTEVLFVVPPKR